MIGVITRVLLEEIPNPMVPQLVPFLIGLDMQILMEPWWFTSILDGSTGIWTPFFQENQNPNRDT